MKLRSVFLSLLTVCYLLDPSRNPANSATSEDRVARDAGFKFEMGCLGYKTVVQRVDPNSPASKAGLLPGDEILTMYDRPIIGLPSDKILELFHSSKKPIKLTVLRDDELIDFTISKNFVIPAWSEAELLRQLDAAREERKPVDVLACLLNLGKFYTDRGRVTEANSRIVEAMQLSDTIWTRRDPRRIRVLYRYLMNDLTADSMRLEKRSNTDSDFKLRYAELLTITKVPSRIPKPYASLLSELSSKLQVGKTDDSDKQKIELLQRAVLVARKGSSSLTQFDNMLGARENVKTRYIFDDLGICNFSEFRLVGMLNELTRLLLRAKRIPEATKVAQELNDLESELRKRHVPFGQKYGAELLFDIYRNRGMEDAALRVAAQEIAYLRGRPQPDDPISNFESQGALHGYLLRSGILKEQARDYKDANNLFQQSFDVLKTIDDSANSEVEQGYRLTTSRFRQHSLWSEARCAAALGQYGDAKKILKDSFALSENAIFSLPAKLDLALICLFDGDRETARKEVIGIYDNISLNLRSAYRSGMTNTQREIRLLVELNEMEKAGKLVMKLRDEIKGDEFYRRMRPSKEAEVEGLTELLKKGTTVVAKTPSDLLKNLSIEQPITECFLTLYECGGSSTLQKRRH